MSTLEPVYVSLGEEWIAILSRLWIAFDKPLDPERLQIYIHELGSVPLGLLELAVSRTIRNHKFSNVPSVADVWRSVNAELGNPYDVDQAIQEWCDRQWRKVVVEFAVPA